MSAKKVMMGSADEASGSGSSAAAQPDHLRIPDVCRRLSLGRTAVYGLMDRGELCYVKFGRARRIPRDALEEYIRKATVPARV